LVFARRGQEDGAPSHTDLLFCDQAMRVVAPVRIDGCKDVHEIFDTKDFIILTSTYTNELFCYFHESGKVVKVFVELPAVSQTQYTRTYDVNHINSLFVDIEQDSLYLYCHNHGPSFIAVLAWSDFATDQLVSVKRIIPRAGNKGHSIWMSYPYIYSLSSSEGCLVLYNMVDESTSTHFIDDMFLRGLHIHKGALFLGGSSVSVDRGVRVFMTKAILYAVDPGSLSVISKVELPERPGILDFVIEE
jgi:hypothetical protein